MSPETRCTRYRRILCLGTAIGLMLSYPLWVGGGNVPRIPFVDAWPALSGPLGWVMLLGLLTLLGWIGLSRTWEPATWAFLGLLIFEVLGDQTRLQTWILQVSLAFLVMLALPPPHALGACRALVLAIYIYSGLSKLDALFAREIGPVFLEALLRTFGLSSESWGTATRTRAVLLLPMAELLIGLGLISRASRAFAMFGAMGLHIVLIAILGPWRLGHSWGVLLWNACLLVEVPILFWPDPEPAQSLPDEKVTPRCWFAYLVVAGALILPLSERWGWADAWPSHAVYSSHLAKAEVYIHESNLETAKAFPTNRLDPPDPDGWRRIDLINWCRDEQGVPPYPNPRVSLGLAEWISERYGVPRPIRVELLGQADRVTGRRSSRRTLMGTEAIRKARDRYLLNARPASP